MKRIIPLFVLLFASFFNSCKDKHSNLADGLYAEIETSKGAILVALEFKKAPVTVANFVTLAEGTNTFVSSDYKGKKLFDGLKFHRVLSNFMIQGGDPLGNGSGDAGYKFKDEFSDLKFDKGGMLAMANSGPGTNGSQFFITHLETPWLDGKHTIFGHVVEKGMEVVSAIVQDDAINSIKIIRKGEEAKKFDAVKVFSDYFSKEAENQKKQSTMDVILTQKATSDKLAFIATQKASSIKTPTGLSYNIFEKGHGKKPVDGTTVYIQYSGFLEDGTLFDSNDAAVAKAFGKYDAQRDAQGGYANIPFQVGAKEGMIPGFIQGLEKLNFGDRAILFIPSNLAYGENGAGNVIPPNANIIFEVQMFEKL